MSFFSRSRLFEEVVLKSWWVYLFLFLCVFAYEQATFAKQKEKHTLLQELTRLTQEKEKVELIQDDLQLQLESLEDMSWVEMILMKGLGLTPEGSVKIHFYSRLKSNHEERSQSVQ